MAKTIPYTAPEEHVTEQRHTHTLPEGQDQSAGYKHQEYPKVVEHEEGKEPVIVKSAEEETDWKASKETKKEAKPKK